MGKGQLLAAGLALTVAGAAAAPAAAQGLVYRERWGYLHLEHRRAELAHELAGRGADDVAAVAQLVAGPDGGVPFAPVARALARLRGVAADDAFLLRAMLAAYVLPEVCDPDGANEVCRATNVSLFLPFPCSWSGRIAFDLEARDAAGDVVWSARIDQHTELADLSLARPHVAIPGERLPDGRYQLRVRTSIGDAGPRAGDPELRWPFHVLRGYQARAEAALAGAATAAAGLRPAAQAVLAGSSAQVARAYRGEAFAVASEGATDLLRLERMLANVAEGRDPADGVAGALPLQLPVDGGPPLGAVLRRATDADGAGVRGRLVVVAPGAPAYDLTGLRPSAPANRDPGWSAHELEGLGAATGWHVVFLESPGGGRDYAAALRAALALLPAVVDTEGPPLLVCEREAAVIAALRLRELQAGLAGLVLVGTGGVPGPVLRDLGPLPVRLAPLHGVGGDALARTVAYAATLRADGWTGDVDWLGTAPMPWTHGLGAWRSELAAFGASCLPPPRSDGR